MAMVCSILMCCIYPIETVRKDGRGVIIMMENFKCLIIAWPGDEAMRWHAVDS